MPQIGFNYLVTHVIPLEVKDARGDASTVKYFATDDGGLFEDEQTMLDELGAAGWELFLVREDPSGPRHYFRRPRA